MRCQSMLLLGTLGILACNTNGEGTNVAAKDGDGSDWVVDMQKVADEYGSSTTGFFGLSHAEAGLPELPGTEGVVVWDQTAKRNPDGSLHTSDGTDYAVKDEDGNLIDPEGYVNIIPMLKDTDPLEQTHIVDQMQDGDVIVYFHPEYDQAKNFMERRASHVAMHYEHTAADGKQLVHHIDNPNSYGPAYNHRPDRRMPFHVYRFQPSEDKAFTARDGSTFSVDNDTANAYAQGAANWAKITNDLSPFADFFTLTLQQRDQLDTFANSAIHGEEIPDLYCSGLAYANLNLALNFPLNEQGLDGLYDTFQSSTYKFSDSGEDLGADALSMDDGLAPFDQLVFEPYQASDIIDSWLEVYMAHLPLEVRQGVIADEGFQQMLVGALSKLEWSDEHSDDKQSEATYTPATPENVARWAAAYGRTAEDTEAYIAADEGIAQAIADIGLDTTGMTPMEVFKELEAVLTSTRFVPPRIWMDVADAEDSNLVYVGTVLNCELLSAADGSEADACAGGGAQSTTFKEGAADTLTYPHYQVADGEERTHRRFTISFGPETIGPDSTVTLRASASKAEDLLFVIHTPEDNDTDAEFADQAELSMMEFDSFCTSQHAEGNPCAPATGIALTGEDLGLSGQLDDKTITVRLGDVCDIGAETMTCPAATRLEDGSYALSAEREFSSNARGKWASTMVDMGTDDARADIDSCEQCSHGGAHFNQWVLYVEDGSEPVDDDVVDDTDTDTDTDTDDTPASCADSCGQYFEDAACQCDDQCETYGDCCTDYAEVCETDDAPSDDSCVDRCDEGMVWGATCQCDEGCEEFGNCCEDYSAVCGG